jgi:hypothetical protein
MDGVDVLTWLSLPLGAPSAVSAGVQRASWNPLTVSGTALPDNLLLAAKLVAIAFVLSGQLTELPNHFLPFLSILGDLGSPHGFHLALELIFAFAAAVLLVNRQVRVMCLLLAAVLLVGILSSRAYYHNNRLFTGIFFLLGANHPWQHLRHVLVRADGLLPGAARVATIRGARAISVRPAGTPVGG